jgi:microsomal epoxide hydrolase
MWHRACLALSLLLALVFALAAPAAAADRFFMTSDGVRLHYTDQGAGKPLVLVPGWCMPAWIFDRQITDFSRTYRVIAFDPRAQGESDIPPGGYDPFRRGRDIAELIAQLGPGQQPVVLGWSLGVLDVLAYVHEFGDARIAGLVLVDNSVGEEPAPVPPRHQAKPSRRRPIAREVSMRAFVRSMFRVPPPPDLVDRLTDAALRVPQADAAALLDYRVPRSYWKEAVYATDKPVLYLVTPRFSGQAGNLAVHHADAESVVVQNVGHAMFVDDPARFDSLVGNFLRQRVWR